MINKKEDQTDLDYFRVPHEKDIAKEFFTKFTTGSEVSRKLYPNSKRKKNVGIVSNCYTYRARRPTYFGRWAYSNVRTV